MRDRSSNRCDQRGQSFGKCLLMVVLVFGGIGFYYFNVFQWRHLEDPMNDVTIVEIKDRDVSVLYPFRTKSVKDFIDPTGVQLDIIKDIRKSTRTKQKDVYQVPPEWDQETTEVLNRLRDIMNDAKLRSVPKRYEKQWKEVLWGIHHTYLSVRRLRELCSEEVPALRTQAYKDSLKEYKKAQKKLEYARNFFLREGRD